jgi:thiosulfate/3-mercaptopyruvate sulfurtransferase
MKTDPYPPGDSLVKWVSTDWLAKHINDDDLMLMDVQPNVHDYIMGHLPGAIYLSEGLLRSAWNHLPAMYIPPESLKPILDRAGLDPNRPVVVYSASGRYSKCAAGLGDGLEQTMMAYSLHTFGHNRLHPGRRIGEMESEGHELTRSFPNAIDQTSRYKCEELFCGIR